MAKSRRERTTTGHLLAAIASRPPAADLLLERRLDAEVLLKAARASTDDQPDPLPHAMQRARELASRWARPARPRSTCSSRSSRSARRGVPRDRAVRVDVTLRTAAMQLAMGIVGPRRPSRARPNAPRKRNPEARSAAQGGSRARPCAHATGARAAAPRANTASPCRCRLRCTRAPRCHGHVLGPHATANRPATEQRQESAACRSAREPRRALRPRSQALPRDFRDRNESHLGGRARGARRGRWARDRDRPGARRPRQAPRQQPLPRRAGRRRQDRDRARPRAAHRRRSEGSRRSTTASSSRLPVAELSPAPACAARSPSASRPSGPRCARRTGRVVLFFDEVHESLQRRARRGRRPSSRWRSRAASFRCIGATTPEEYRRVLEADPAFARRFTPIEIEEPAADDAVLVLERVVPALSSSTTASAYADEAIAARWPGRSGTCPAARCPTRPSPSSISPARARAGAAGEAGRAARGRPADVAAVVAELADVPGRAPARDRSRAHARAREAAGRARGRATAPPSRAIATRAPPQRRRLPRAPPHRVVPAARPDGRRQDRDRQGHRRGALPLARTR